MAIKFDGLNVVLEDLENITDFTNIQQAIESAALLVERSARMKAPKEIATSIHSKIDGLEGIVYTNYETAPYVEYGTGKFSIHPMGGRKEVPWVYVEGQNNKPAAKTIHTEDSADQAVAYLQSQGLPAVKTYGSKPQPFMRPALDENKEQILMVLGESLLND